MVDDCNQKFAQRFKELRANGGYTQQQLANLFNVTRPCICYWETGKRVPDYIKLVEICKFFQVSSDYLLGFSDNKNTNFNDNHYVYDPEDFLDMTKLSDEYKRQLKEYYQYLVDKQEKNLSKTNVNTTSNINTTRRY